MEPCTKEEVIESIKTTLGEVRIKQTEIGGDVSHIKSRIDNGMSHTIADMHKNLTDIVPIIQRFISFERRMDDLIWWTAKIGIGAFLSIVAWAIATGWKIK